MSTEIDRERNMLENLRHYTKEPLAVCALSHQLSYLPGMSVVIN